MPYVVMDVEEATLEALKGFLKGAFSEGTVKIRGEVHPWSSTGRYS
ncbi:MAG: hypothetical protein GXO65_06560 [Euryarchaeota archaeon]|nr:hypothetical protein [Euryarchaeota archaeon]